MTFRETIIIHYDLIQKMIKHDYYKYYTHISIGAIYSMYMTKL